ncbi:MAG TPA: TIGR02444 family protein [Pseudomonas sp.]|uniref:TIGR02444 family protein n=1 Tax=Pseudomonas sp. TaxID=306 RepID=UPI002ED88032
MRADLWSFILDFYARPGVEQACLALQASGANVCAVLCGVWLSHQGVACNNQRLQEIRQLATPWHDEVVQPLRELRTRWKTKSVDDEQWMTLRERLKGLELDAERELLTRLEDLTQDWSRQNAKDADAWLTALAGDAACDNHDALQVLRVMAGGV